MGKTRGVEPMQRGWRAPVEEDRGETVSAVERWTSGEMQRMRAKGTEAENGDTENDGEMAFRRSCKDGEQRWYTERRSAETVSAVEGWTSGELQREQKERTLRTGIHKMMECWPLGGAEKTENNSGARSERWREGLQ